MNHGYRFLATLAKMLWRMSDITSASKNSRTPRVMRGPAQFTRTILPHPAGAENRELTIRSATVEGYRTQRGRKPGRGLLRSSLEIRSKKSYGNTIWFQDSGTVAGV